MWNSPSLALHLSRSLGLRKKGGLIATYSELRVHGVSGTAPRDMLYTDPAPRDPIPPDAPRVFTSVYRRPRHDPDFDVQAFHWGGLTAGNWTTAFWILLAPFAFANIAGWMAERKNRVARAGLRVAGLALTALFVAQLGVVLVDMPHHWLHPRIEGMQLRLAMTGLFVLFAVLFFLLVQKASAQSHFQKLTFGQQLDLVLKPGAGNMLLEGDDEGGVQWDDPAGATLADPIVWRRHPIVHRLRRLHLATGILVVGLMAARGTGQEVTEWVIVATLGLLVLVLVATSYIPRAAWVISATALAPTLAIALTGWTLVLLWFGTLPASDHWTGTYETTFHVAIVMSAAAALVLFSGLAPLGAFAIGAQLGGAYGIAAAVVFQYAIGVDEVARHGAGWTAVAMLFLVVVLVFLAARLAEPWDGSDLKAKPDDRGKGTARKMMTLLRRVTVESRAVFKMAAVFAVAAGIVAVYYGCIGQSSCSPFNLGTPQNPAVITIVAILAVLILWWSAHRVFGIPAVLLPIAAGAVIWALYSQEIGITLLGVVLDQTLVGVSIAVTILLPAGFIANSLVKGFRDAERRRKVGILWDVASFFPRWYHPLAPPGYGPFVVQKLKDELEAHHRDVLSAHSQGAMIALVTLGQMDDDLPDSLVTYGCQLGLHYPQLFPTAGIPELVERVQAKLGPGSWISLWRPNDPLGGVVDGSVLDRPVGEGAGHSGYELTDAFNTARRDLVEGGPVRDQAGTVRVTETKS